MALWHRAVAWLLPASTTPAQVSVAVAENEPQAELMSQLLHEAGIPCSFQSVGGLSAPLTPAGRREIVVNASDAERAWRVLIGAEDPALEDDSQPSDR